MSIDCNAIFFRFLLPLAGVLGVGYWLRVENKNLAFVSTPVKSLVHNKSINVR